MHAVPVIPVSPPAVLEADPSRRPVGILWRNTSRIGHETVQACLKGATDGQVSRHPARDAQIDLHDQCADGALTVSQAAAEVIWGEVLKHALPFGAVPAYAIVRGGAAAPRGVLLMRQSALRATDYQDAAVGTLYDDVVPMFGDLVRHLHGSRRLNRALVSVARRYAEQVAAGFARGVPAGILAPGAFALDGRVFGAAALTPEPLLPSQGSQLRAIVQSLRAFHQQLRTHLVQHTDGLMQRTEFLGMFWRTYRRAREVHVLKMSGLPARFWIKVEGARRTRLFRTLRRCGPGVWPALLAEAALADNACLDRCLQSLLADDALRRAFITDYVVYRDRFVAMLPASQRPYARLFIALQAQRLNGGLPAVLSAPGLLRQLREFDSHPERLTEFIEQTIGLARYQVQDLHPQLPGPTTQGQIAELMYLDTPLPGFVADCMHRAGASPGAMDRIALLVAACGFHRQMAAA